MCVDSIAMARDFQSLFENFQPFAAGSTADVEIKCFICSSKAHNFAPLGFLWPSFGQKIIDLEADILPHLKFVPEGRTCVWFSHVWSSNGNFNHYLHDLMKGMSVCLKYVLKAVMMGLF